MENVLHRALLKRCVTVSRPAFCMLTAIAWKNLPFEQWHAVLKRIAVIHTMPPRTALLNRRVKLLQSTHCMLAAITWKRLLIEQWHHLLRLFPEMVEGLDNLPQQTRGNVVWLVGCDSIQGSRKWYLLDT